MNFAKHFLWLIFMLLFANFCKAQTTVTLNPGTTTWTVPAGVTAVNFQAWGGGGAGGGSNNNNDGGAGGGAGGYTAKNLVPVSGTITVAVGTAGVGASNANGTAGGNTIIASGIGMSANGGGGGPRNAGTGGLGGAAAGGTTNTPGGNGQVGGGNSGGNGGSSPAGGTGGNGSTNADGQTGNAPGGGGGGGEFGTFTNRAGGNGGNGRIIITYTLPTITGFTPNNGCANPGTPINITGANFTGASGVSFNGTPAVFTVNSATSITATVPAGATTGTIRITNPYGFVNSAGTFTVNPQPAVANITGTLFVCPSGTTILSDATPGGVWSSANNSIATVNGSGTVTGVTSGSVSISYTITSGGCSTTVSAPVTVYSNPSLSGPSSACLGSSAQFTPANSGTWSSNNISVATIDNSGNVTTISPGSTTFVFTNTSTGCSATTALFTVTVQPSITGQPAASQTVCSGTAVSFTVAATGASLSYQWFNGGVSLSNGGNISGANSPVLTLNPVLTSDASANYHCVVSGSCSPPASSADAQLVVIEAVAITSQPVSAQVFCSGSAASISISATGAGLTYQWYNGATALANAGSFSGVSSPTLTINPVLAANASANYHCIVSGTAPCNGVNSANASITVNEIPAVTTQPVTSQTVCYGDPVSISIGATGGNLVYQWFNGNTAVANGGNISGAATPVLTINPSQVSDASADYHCVVSNACAVTADSNHSQLIVNQKPVIPTQNIAACSETAFVSDPVDGMPTSATIVPSNTLYSWPAPTVTGGMTGGSAQAGQALISETFVNPTNIAQTATYTITPTSGTSGNCIGNPFTLVVRVNPLPSLNNISPIVCSGETLAISPTNGGGNIVPAGTVYTWSLPATTGGISGATAGNAQSSFNQTLFNPTNSPQTATYNVTATSGACVGSTFSITVTVNPKPDVSGSIATQTLCSGTAISPIVITNPNAVSGSTSFNWTRNNTANLTGIAASGSGNTISGSLSNGTNTQQTTTFMLYAISDDGCVSLPATVTVKVDPLPLAAASPSSQTVCSGSSIIPVNLTASNGVAGTTFTWIRDNTVNVTGIAASGSGNIVTGTFINNTAVSQTSVFTITATANGCSTATTFAVTINARPTVTASPLTQTICGGIGITPIAISNPNGISGTTFSWTRNNTLNVTGISGSGTGASISGNLINNTNINQTVSFTVTASAAGCASSAIVSDVVVTPAPLVLAAPVSQTLCNGSPFNINFSNSNNIAGTTYSWVRDNTANLTGISSSGSGNSVGGTLMNGTAVTQTTTFTVTATAPNGCSKTITASVTIYAPFTAPVIGSSQTVCVLSTPGLLSMTTAPTGGSTSYTYQWQRSDDNVTFTNIGGATGTTYQPPYVNGGTDNTFYRLIVSNGCLPATVISNSVFVEVVSNVGFTFDIDDGLSGPLCPGSSFTPQLTSIHLNTSAVRFSWSSNPTYVTPASGGPVGTTSGSFFFFRTSSGNIGPLTVQNNTNASVTTQVTVTPSVYNYPGPPSGSFICSVTPQVINVTIRPKPVATITAPAANTTICSGSSAGVTVTGNITDAAMSYNWVRTNTTNVSGTNSGSSGTIAIGGSFVINNALTNTTTATQSVQYTVTPVSNGCNGTATTITIIVAPLLTPGSVAASQTICNGGDPAAFTQITAATGSNPSFQWQSSIISATGPWTDISGANGTTYDAPAGLTQSTWYIRVVTSVVNGVTCSVANTTPVKVTINSINPGVVAGDQTVCNGGDPTVFTVTTPATGAGTVTYQWQSNTGGCAGPWNNIALNGTLAAYDPPSGLAVTTYYRRITISNFSGNICSDYSNCITVTVNNFNPGVVAGDQILCGSNPAAFTETTAASGAGTFTYQWQSNTTGCAGSWSDISGANGSVYDAPSGLAATTYYHRVTTSVLNGISCSLSTNCITVTANTVTGGTINGNRTVCLGGDPAAFTVTVASTGSNITYQWQTSPTGGIGTWTDISGATAATYDVPGPVTTVRYYQRITYSAIGGVTCTAASNPVTVFVNDVTASTIAGDQVVCAQDPNAFTVVTPASGFGAVSYQWQKSIVGCGGPWTNITGANSSVYDPPVLTVTTYYHVIVTSTLNSVACTATSNCVTVICNAKTWNGSISTDWNNASNWTPIGVPTPASCVLVPNTTIKPYIQGSNYDAFAYSLTILNGGTLEVIPTNSITVTDVVNVNTGGAFNVKNNASLVQLNNVSDIGNINMERSTQPMYRYDYTYWNSPLTATSNFTLGNLSPNTQYDKYYSWNPTNGGGNGNWQQEGIATVMNPAKGYIVRAPNSFSTSPAVTQAYTANFIGTPNNGNISIPIATGTQPATSYNDKLNLIGNPYPSAVNANLFLGDPANTPLLDGTIYFWTHHSPPSAAYANPFYGNFQYNYTAGDYATYNLLGGTNTVPAGYGGSVPNGFIAAGQSFFIKGIASGNAVFKNSMREKSNNSAFFRMTSDFEKHRIWLNLANTQGGFSQLLVGYAEGATVEFDRGLDGNAFGGNFVSFYSVLPDEHLTIQGRPLPFDANDQVNLGYHATVANTYLIGVDHMDALFETENVYLEDKLLHTINDIKVAPYSFTSEAGTFDDRFVLRYNNATLSTYNPADSGVGLTALIIDKKLKVMASEKIMSIKVFDMTGKLVKTYTPGSPGKKFEDDFIFADGIYFAKTSLESGAVITSKLISN